MPKSKDYCARSHWSHCRREQSETDIRPDPHGELICLIWWQRQWNPQRPRSSRRPQSTTYGVNKKDYRSFMLKEDMSEDNWPMSHKFAAWQSWVEWKKVFGVFWSPGTSYSESGPNLEPRPHLPHQQQAKKNPVETSKPPQPAGGPHSKSRAHPARPAVREALVNRLPPIKSGQFYNKIITKSLFTHRAMIKHAVDQIKSATGIKTDKTWQKN